MLLLSSTKTSKGYLWLSIAVLSSEKGIFFTVEIFLKNMRQDFFLYRMVQPSYSFYNPIYSFLSLSLENTGFCFDLPLQKGYGNYKAGKRMSTTSDETSDLYHSYPISKEETPLDTDTCATKLTMTENSFKSRIISLFFRFWMFSFLNVFLGMDFTYLQGKCDRSPTNLYNILSLPKISRPLVGWSMIEKCAATALPSSYMPEMSATADDNYEIQQINKGSSGSVYHVYSKQNMKSTAVNKKNGLKVKNSAVSPPFIGFFDELLNYIEPNKLPSQFVMKVSYPNSQSSLINEFYILKNINTKNLQQSRANHDILVSKDYAKPTIFPNVFGGLMISPVPSFDFKSEVDTMPSSNDKNQYRIRKLEDIAVTKEKGQYSLKLGSTLDDKFAEDNRVVILFMTPFFEDASQITNLSVNDQKETKAFLVDQFIHSVATLLKSNIVTTDIQLLFTNDKPLDDANAEVSDLLWIDFTEATQITNLEADRDINSLIAFANELLTFFPDESLSDLQALLQCNVENDDIQTDLVDRNNKKENAFAVFCNL